MQSTSKTSKTSIENSTIEKPNIFSFNEVEEMIKKINRRKELRIQKKDGRESISN